ESQRRAGWPFLEDTDPIASRRAGRHRARAVPRGVQRQTQRVLQARPIEGGGQMRHVVVDALDSGARTEVVPEMVADSLGKRVVGDPGGHDEVDVLKTDVRDPKTGLDGVIGK